MRVTQIDQQNSETDEGGESPIFHMRLLPKVHRDIETIVALDEDVTGRTEAVRAAIRDYAKKLRRRVGQ